MSYDCSSTICRESGNKNLMVVVYIIIIIIIYNNIVIIIIIQNVEYQLVVKERQGRSCMAKTDQNVIIIINYYYSKHLCYWVRSVSAACTSWFNNKLTASWCILHSAVYNTVYPELRMHIRTVSYNTIAGKTCCIWEQKQLAIW